MKLSYEDTHLQGACDLLLALGWSTGHGDSWESIVEEACATRDELIYQRELLEATIIDLRYYISILWGARGKP